MGDRARRLRIVHVSDCYQPRLGGIEVQVAGLAQMQAAAGHETHVVTATPGPSSAAGSGSIPGAATEVHRIVARLPGQLPVHPRAGYHLHRLFRRLDPDVVHVHVGAISPFAWPAAWCAVRAGLPLVVSVHSMWDPVTQAVYRALDTLCGWARWPLVIAPVSHAAATPIRRLVGDRAPVYVVPNGLDLDRWRSAESLCLGSGGSAVPGAGEDGHGQDTIRVIAVGRLAPRKQPVTLLRLLRATADRLGPAGAAGRPALRATIVGDGPAEPAMRRYLLRHDMTGWVDLPGRVDRDRLPWVLAGADVFLAPAGREAFGLAALEARAAGLPVVARSRTGVADFVRSGRDGLLASDEPGLVDALVRLATDTALRTEIRTHNVATAPAEQSWPAVLAALDRCYDAARPASLRASSGAGTAAEPRPSGGLPAGWPGARIRQ